MDTDLPLATLAALAAGANVLFPLGTLLALVSGILAGATLAGIARRTVSRLQGWRGLAACIIAQLLSALSLGAAFAMAEWPLAISAGSRQGGLLDAASHGISLAFTLTLVMAVASAALARLSSPRRGVPRLASNLARVFTPGWVKSSAGYNTEQRDDSDFEITMASGEEVEKEERELIENILELGDTTVREVMKPRPDVSSLDGEWPAERILAEVAGSRYSRFPVYEGTIDNITGVLHLRDLFEFLARGDGLEAFDLNNLVKEPLFIPESKKVDDALREVQRVKSHLAVVLDEFGGTAGIVTIEDLLEEIVGEIQDEYDDESKLAHQRDDGSWVVTAQLQLDDLNDLLGTQLDAEDVDTVGGFIVHGLGRIPKAQDILEAPGLRFTVLSVDKNRVGRVKVELRA